MHKDNIHLLYSYRRCPYAMRARIALLSARIQCEVHEINFRDKPEHMLKISPKGTVPVLRLNDGKVIDESRDIVMWALSQNDPNAFLHDGGAVGKLVDDNDGWFKRALDRYKYPDRFPDEDCSNAREQGLEFLQALNERLMNTDHLLSNVVSVADICIFPFVRQFANVDREWFDALEIKPLQKWLDGHLNSDLFLHIFRKQKETPYALF
ncbi:MAG: glutathione S-transferase [Alphaproteobacteria bacterium]|nr:glutathione S-transferase [Alphaproteobacteria bacterium]